MSVKDFITIIKQSEPVYPQKVFGQKRHVYTCLNSAGYMYARKKPELYSNMDGIFVDVILMCKALK